MINSRSHRLPRRALAIATCALLLQACGGGGSGDAGTPVATNPTVTGVTVDRLSYGRLSTFTIVGTNLASGATFTATGCDGVAVAAGGTATQQVVTCTPNKALSVRLAASSSGAEFYNSTQAVPKPRVTLTTTMGAVVIELEPAVVQLTVDNFLAYANAGFYNGTIFHRVIPGFMVQGGGFTGVVGATLAAQVGLRAPIALEIGKGLSNLRGTIAMASTSTPGSATSQFFLNTVDNTFLDAPIASPTNPSPGYAVFGRIVSSLAVIDAMSAVITRTVGFNDDVPLTDIVVQTAAQTL